MSAALSRPRRSVVLHPVEPDGPQVAAEAALVLRLKRGEATAFEQVHTRWNAPLFGFLYRLLGRADLAEDLLQETWMRLATRAYALRADSRLGPWLFTVARNLTLSFRRWSALHEDSQRLALLHQREASPGDSPFEATAAAETEARLEQALAALPPKYREVLLLVGVEGLPQDEAATILGLRPEALRQRLLRARVMIEDRLQDERVAGEPPPGKQQRQG